MLPAASFLTVTADATIFTGRGVLRGWSISNNDGTTAHTVSIYDGPAATGNTIARLICPAPASIDYLAPAPGIVIERGLFIDLSGTDTTVSVWFNTETRYLSELGVFDADTVEDTWLGAIAHAVNIGGM